MKFKMKGKRKVKPFKRPKNDGAQLKAYVEKHKVEDYVRRVYKEVEEANAKAE